MADGALEKVGMPSVSLTLLIVTPIALAFLFFCLRSAGRCMLPLRWQPGARRRLQRKKLLGRHAYEIRPDALLITGAEDGQTERFAWPDITGLVEAPGSWLLRHKTKGYLIIPKSGCRNQAEARAVKSALQARI